MISKRKWTHRKDHEVKKNPCKETHALRKRQQSEAMTNLPNAHAMKRLKKQVSCFFLSTNVCYSFYDTNHHCSFKLLKLPELTKLWAFYPLDFSDLTPTLPPHGQKQKSYYVIPINLTVNAIVKIAVICSWLLIWTWGSLRLKFKAQNPLIVSLWASSLP